MTASTDPLRSFRRALGRDLDHRLNTTQAVVGPLRCTYRGCRTAPTRRIQGEHGGPWYGCDKHWPAMNNAMSGGQRIDYTVTLTPLNEQETDT